MFRKRDRINWFEDRTYTASQIQQALKGTGYRADFKGRKSCIIRNGRNVIAILDRKSRHDVINPEYKLVFGKDDIRITSPLDRVKERGYVDFILPEEKIIRKPESEKIRSRPGFYIRDVDNLVEALQPEYTIESRRELRRGGMKPPKSEYNIVWNSSMKAWTVRTKEGTLVAEISPQNISRTKMGDALKREDGTVNVDNATVKIFDNKLSSYLVDTIRSKYVISENLDIASRTVSKHLLERIKAVNSSS